MDDAGNVLPLKQMLPHVRAAISSVKVRTEVDKDGNVNHISEVRFWNKISALEILVKYLCKLVELMEKGKRGDSITCLTSNYRPRSKRWRPSPKRGTPRCGRTSHSLLPITPCLCSTAASAGLWM